MKKNISINLQGIIFHVEEDGYLLLEQYLASVKRYFASYEGHVEIVADIEARMAEVLLTKLSPAKQVITRDDVQALITQLGTVTDFEQFDVEEPVATATTAHQARSSSRLMRDEARKVLGGVAAGIANYLGTDPLWIRLLIVFLVLIAPFTAGISAGVIILLYIIFWIVLPSSNELPEVHAKKLFRDPDDKKLGGVASGIALYFGVDAAVVRLLFIISVFLGGAGIVLYLLLWIVVPEAKSITDKVQMQGNPVTLSSIEASLKQSLNMRDENGNESTLARIILLPIRLLSQLIGWLGRALGPLLVFLVELIRIVAGIILILMAAVLIIGLVSLMGAAMGVFNVSDPGSPVQVGGLPVEYFTDTVPVFGVIAAFVTGIIPAIFLMIAGVGLLFRRFYMRTGLGWSLFAIWVVSVFSLGFSIAAVSQNFKNKGNYTTETLFPVGQYQTVVLKFGEDSGSDINEPVLQIQTYNGTDVKLVQEYSARGKTYQEAMENARQISYITEQQDSLLVMSNYFSLQPNATFRKQNLDLTLYLPVNKTYRVTPEFANFLPQESVMSKFIKYPAAYHDFQLSPNGMYRCLTCPASDTLETEATDTTRTWGTGTTTSAAPLLKPGSYGSHSKTYSFKNFNKIDAGGAYHIRVRRGSRFSVRAETEDADELRELKVEQNGSTLTIGRRSRFLNFRIFDKRKPVLVEIEMPELTSVDYSGAIVSDITGFRTDELRVDQSGAVKTSIDVVTTRLILDLSGASAATLTGRTGYLEADASGACHLQARNMQVLRANLDFSGACRGTVYVTEELRAEASGASHIGYTGNPVTTRLEQTGASSINKE